MLNKFLFAYILLFWLTITLAWSEKLYYKDHIYKENIETVLFYKSNNTVTYSYPVIDLSNPDDELILSFDDLEGGYKSLQYTIIHCERDWSKSNLLSSEYLEGSTIENVVNYEPSFNAYQKYTHYWLNVPTRFLRPKISGNYLLVIYMTGEENNLVITRRFYVVDNKVTIAATIKQPTYARYRNTKQEIDFQVNYSGFNIMNPMNDIKVVIRQNQRWDNLLTLSKPQYIRDNVLIYDYEDENLFDGYGEFRFVDLRSFKYPGFGVNKIKLQDSFYHLYLFIDEDRSILSYADWSDINGNRIIAGQDKNIPENELDYVIAHFKLDSPFPPEDGDVYMFGALTDWEIKDAFKLTYDSDNKLYTTSQKLKQGYYNYQYVTWDKNTGTIDPARFEGSHFETENDYLLCVYYRSPYLYTDILIGVAYLNAVKNR